VDRRIIGLVGGYALAYWTSVVAYPINVAWAPFHSWPAFSHRVRDHRLGRGVHGSVRDARAQRSPAAASSCVQRAQLRAGVEGSLLLVIETADLLFDAAKTRAFLEGLETRQVSEVEF
jgi:hypothetical protein